MRSNAIAVSITLLPAGAGAALASPPGFDEPLAEFSRAAGGDVHSAASGVGTADGANSFVIPTAGTVLEAWVYWSGEVRRDPVGGTVYGPDPGLTLSGGAIVGSLPLAGAEVARRAVLPDDGDNGGEVVMKAAVPPSAFLRFAVGGLVEQPLSANERTFVLTGSGPKPANLLGGVGSLLEQNTLNLNLEAGGFFRGRKLAVFEGEVPLAEGDTWLCYQIEHDLATGRQFPDPYFNFFASLDLDRTPCDGDGCLTRTPGFWGTHPRVAAQYLSLESCGLTIDSTLPRSVASATEDMCISGQDAKGAKTSMQQLQLVRQCMAANLNLAASQAGGGRCGGAIEARIAECCASLCNSGAAGNAISNSMCIEDIDEFNNSADSLEPYGPFLSPGPADPAPCKSSRGNGWVNKSDDQGDKRKLGPAGGGKDTTGDSPNAPSVRSSPKLPGSSARGKH
ncbi:MAG: hypothetical protein MUC67_03745 [Acidobacteria bacterium]|jgi:hypothetical protein|nr:hypothetical protein [Acidobacteriota bacterium]